jgi:beta-lactam-binding protein with PASTA domain
MKIKITIAVLVAASAITATSASPAVLHQTASRPSATSSPVTVVPSARLKRVPNEVGKNHQAAQDDLQAHGFFNLRERDCTGRGRLLLFDRNWKVVRQSPRAGSRVSTNRAITLCSVKYSD